MELMINYMPLLHTDKIPRYTLMFARKLDQ